jgi:hypothetical protein
MLGISTQGLSNYLPRLALNRDPPDLCLLSSWDYRREPPAPGMTLNFVLVFLNAIFLYVCFLADFKIVCHSYHFPFCICVTMKTSFFLKRILALPNGTPSGSPFKA